MVPFDGFTPSGHSRIHDSVLARRAEGVVCPARRAVAPLPAGEAVRVLLRRVPAGGADAAALALRGRHTAADRDPFRDAYRLQTPPARDSGPLAERNQRVAAAVAVRGPSDARALPSVAARTSLYRARRRDARDRPRRIPRPWRAPRQPALRCPRSAENLRLSNAEAPGTIRAASAGT